MALSDLTFDFMRYRVIAGRVSAGLVLLSAISLGINQVEWGLDFTGGTLVEVAYEDPVSPESIRNELSAAGYDGHVVQYFGSDNSNKRSTIGQTFKLFLKRSDKTLGPIGPYV